MTQYDMQRAIALSKAMHAESKYSSMPYDPVEIRVLIRQADLDDSIGLFFLIDSEQPEPVGLLCMHVHEHIFSRTKMVDEMAMYVAPGFRSFTAVRTLVRFAEEWSKSKGARYLTLNITASHTPHRVSALYERLGYEHWGIIHRKEL